ncbi:MAG: MFS transporter [Thermoguttaceae bacterium]|jgi:MFS family permease|nr:MFS transporter [Thermoguttaceae bacterium]
MKPFVRAFRKETPYKLLLLSLLFSSLGYGIYKGVIDNFFAETVQMTEFDRGVTEFFRELPGLMLVFILAAFYTFSAERFFRIGAVIIVIGMAMLSLVPTTKALVILATFVYSLGDHIQIGMKNTLALQYAKEGRGGRALGHLNAVSQIGCLIGFVIVAAAFIFFLSGKPYRAFFAAATVLMAISMFVSFGLRTQSATNKNNSRFYFRRKYRKYYMLEVLYGARKQVFFTFGPYVLILLYGASAEEISILFAISSVACFTMSPIVGKIIDKLGYKTVMIADTLLLAVVCFFYGFAHHLFPMRTAFYVCCVNYILDSVISLAAMAANVYVQDISETQDEIQKTVSTGLSVNHLITVLIALFGGWIWKTLGVETLFVLSAILGLFNSAYAATLKTAKQLGIKKAE